MSYANVAEFSEIPKIEEIFISQSGILGKRKRIIYLQPKQNNELEFEKPLNEKQRLNSIKLIEVYSQKVRNLSRINFSKGYVFGSMGFCVDHKISVYSCFHNGVSVEDAAHICNLRIIHWKENCKKGKRNHIDTFNRWIIEKYNFTKNPMLGDVYLNEILLKNRSRAYLYNNMYTKLEYNLCYITV